MKWNGVYSEDGRWMLQDASIYIGRGVPRAREVRVRESGNPDGGPPYTREHGIYDTRREAKRAIQEMLDGEA